MGPAIAATAPTTSTQALQQEQSYASGMKTPDQLLQGQQQNLGTASAQQQVSGLQQAINNSTQLLNNVAPSVMGRTANSLETSAQANAQIANEQTPINQSLGQEQQQYNTANSNYQNLEQQAETLANSDSASQQNQLGYLQNVYSALFGQEQQQASQQAAVAQAAQQQSQFQQSLQEQQREANMSASSKSTTAPTLGGNNPQQNGMNMTQRNGGGFNFTGTNGQAVSAGAYAKANNIPIGTLLQQMGQSGDAYAKQAYNEIQANQDYYKAHPEALKQEFSPLFWGT